MGSFYFQLNSTKCAVIIYVVLILAFIYQSLWHEYNVANQIVHTISQCLLSPLLHRAILSISGEPVVMSTDFNPEYERRRLQSIAEQHPDLLGDEFCPRQFTQRVTRKDLGNQMLYRDSRMEGWYVFTFYHFILHSSWASNGWLDTSWGNRVFLRSMSQLGELICWAVYHSNPSQHQQSKTSAMTWTLIRCAVELGRKLISYFAGTSMVEKWGGISQAYKVF